MGLNWIDRMKWWENTRRMKIHFSFIRKTVKGHNLHAECKEAIKGLMSPEGATIYIFHEGFSGKAPAQRSFPIQNVKCLREKFKTKSPLCRMRKRTTKIQLIFTWEQTKWKGSWPSREAVKITAILIYRRYIRFIHNFPLNLIRNIRKLLTSIIYI